MKAMQVTAMLKRAPSEEQKQMNEYLQTKAREVVDCDPFKFDWSKLKDNMQQMLRTNKALSNPFHMEEKEKEFYDCKRISVGKRRVYVPKSMTKSAVKKTKDSLHRANCTKRWREAQSREKMQLVWQRRPFGRLVCV